MISCCGRDTPLTDGGGLLECRLDGIDDRSRAAACRVMQIERPPRLLALRRAVVGRNSAAGTITSDAGASYEAGGACFWG
jgi:hypothetical protein